MENFDQTRYSGGAENSRFRGQGPSYRGNSSWRYQRGRGNERARGTFRGGFNNRGWDGPTGSGSSGSNTPGWNNSKTNRPRGGYHNSDWNAPIGSGSNYTAGMSGSQTQSPRGGFHNSGWNGPPRSGWNDSNIAGSRGSQTQRSRGSFRGRFNNRGSVGPSGSSGPNIRAESQRSRGSYRGGFNNKNLDGPSESGSSGSNIAGSSGPQTQRPRGELNTGCDEPSSEASGSSMGGPPTCISTLFKAFKHKRDTQDMQRGASRNKKARKRIITNENPVKLAVIPSDYPETVLQKKDMGPFHQLFRDLLNSAPVSLSKIIVEKNPRAGVIYVTCNDSYAEHWFRTNLWGKILQQKTLKVIPATDLPDLKPIKMAYKSKDINLKDNKQVLKLIQQYNPLKTNEWRVVDILVEEEHIRRIVTMDRESAEAIIRAGYVVNVGTESCVFKALDEDIEDEFEDATINETTEENQASENQTGLTGDRDSKVADFGNNY